MGRMFWGQLSVLPLLAVMAVAVAAQVPDASQNGHPPGSPPPGDTGTSADATAAPTTQKTNKPEVTVNGKAPRDEQPLPTLPPDEAVRCLEKGGFNSVPLLAFLCDKQIDWERHAVVEACINRSGNTAPPRVIQACTELMDRSILEHWAWFFPLAYRGDAYLAQGDKRHALDDYNEAIKLAPHNAALYYNRGIFFVAQSDNDAALRDFEKAIGIDHKLVPALRQRAKIYQARGNFVGARADYSEAIGLQPKNAALWSERGYVCLRQHDYESAIRDEAQAIQLDPKLARAYFLRGAAAAFGALGDRADAVSDIRTGVRLDPSLDHYVMSKGKTAFLALPPL